MRFVDVFIPLGELWTLRRRIEWRTRTSLELFFTQGADNKSKFTL